MTSYQVLSKLLEVDKDKLAYVKSQVNEESFRVIQTALEGYLIATGQAGFNLFLDGILIALVIKQGESAQQLQEMLEKI